MIVMLSPPMPWLARGSALTISSSISAPISCGGFLFILSHTYLTHSSFVRQSQMPSQPMMMNSSPSLRVVLCRRGAGGGEAGSGLERVNGCAKTATCGRQTRTSECRAPP